MKLNEDDLMFISNPGRQGDEDGTTFLIKNVNKCIPYRVGGWMYGPKDGEDYISMDDAFKVFPEWQNAWAKEDQMTKSQKYRMSRIFKRKTFDMNPKKRCNYVHQIVRFDAYLTIISEYKDLFK